MLRLNNLKISARLTLLSGLMAVLIATIGLFSLLQLNKVKGDAEEIANNWLPSVTVVSAMNTNTSDYRIAELQHVLSTDAADMSSYERDMEKVSSEFEANAQGYAKLISSPPERALWDEFRKEWEQYQVQHTKFLALSRANQNVQARDVLRGESQRTFDSASATLLKLVELNKAGGVAASARSDSTYSFARNLLVGGLLLSLVLALLISRIIGQSLAQPIEAVATAAEQLANGKLGNDIDAEQGADTELGRLLTALRSTDQRLCEIIGAVSNTAESVGSASHQISQGNDDLSQRTQEQASSLEETAATMEQMSSTVKRNSDNAHHADQIGRQARTQADSGAEVVTRTIAAMSEINTASRKIGDIINVIDEIAFQTNLLALNAAVEAARAGEQGRGFAVVASEVRNLAQRSASAAKEIKTLINDSVAKVNIGTELVNESGKALNDIVANVKRVTDIVAEIAAASTEQSDGIDQINLAVTQLDSTTQQNAALVEEAASASKAMEDQAQQLVEQFAFFEIRGQTARATVAHPAAATTPKAKLVSHNRTPQRKTAAFKPLASRSAPMARASGDGQAWAEF